MFFELWLFYVTCFSDRIASHEAGVLKNPVSDGGAFAPFSRKFINVSYVNKRNFPDAKDSCCAIRCSLHPSGTSQLSLPSGRKAQKGVRACVRDAHLGRGFPLAPASFPRETRSRSRRTLNLTRTPMHPNDSRSRRRNRHSVHGDQRAKTSMFCKNKSD